MNITQYSFGMRYCKQPNFHSRRLKKGLQNSAWKIPESSFLFKFFLQPILYSLKKFLFLIFFKNKIRNGAQLHLYIYLRGLDMAVAICRQYGSPLGEEFYIKAAWSDLFTTTVSNNFPCKLIILESYRLLPIYTSRNGLISK